MTNGDRIRQMINKELVKFLDNTGVPFNYYVSRVETIHKMTDEELFEFLDKGAAMICSYTDCLSTDCSVCLKKWLEQEDVLKQPTIEAEPMQKGRWLSLKGWFNKSIVKCSVCGNTLDMDGVNAGRGDANFCPNCGADMRGVIEDAETDD